MEVIIRRTKDKLRQLTPSLRRELEGAVGRAGEVVVQRARSNIQSMGAVDTGFMLGSGVVESAGPLSRRVRFTAPYSLYVHEGHHTRGGGSFVPGRPYLSTAVTQERGQIEKLAADAVQRAVR